MRVREGERETGRLTDRQADRQTDRGTHTQYIPAQSQANYKPYELPPVLMG